MDDFSFSSQSIILSNNLPSNVFTCENCENFPLISIQNLNKIETKCKNNHTNNFQTEKFIQILSTKKIPFCSNCKKNISNYFSDTKKNYYCKNCLSVLNLNDTYIEYSKLNNFCAKHNLKFEGYCSSCKINFCNDCKEHKNHNILFFFKNDIDLNEIKNFDNNINDINKFVESVKNEKNSQIQNLQKIIDKTNKNFNTFQNSINNVLILFKQLINLYNSRLIYNYEIMESLKNFNKFVEKKNNFKNFEVFNDIDKIKNLLNKNNNNNNNKVKNNNNNSNNNSNINSNNNSNINLSKSQALPKKLSLQSPTTFLSNITSNSNYDFSELISLLESKSNISDASVTLKNSVNKNLTSQDFSYQGNNKSTNWGNDIEKVGGRDYYPPIGWTAFGLNVKNKYDNGDSTWMGHSNSKNEWCIAYHPTSIKFAKSILLNGLQPGQGQFYEDYDDENKIGRKVGKGVYLYPKIKDAESHLKYDDDDFSCIFMCRVNTENMRIPKDSDYIIYVADTKDLRPYRLCLKKN
jgi:hypothetical protein